MILYVCQSTFLGGIMAIIIKVLDANTRKPKKGIRVSYSSNRGHGSEKWTDDSGCVHYQVDPISAVVTIKGDRKPEQRLNNGENVFYIWIVSHSQLVISRLACGPLFYIFFIFTHFSRSDIFSMANFVFFSIPLTRIHIGTSHAGREERWSLRSRRSSLVQYGGMSI